MTGFICSSPIFKYEMWTFEIHSFCGPCPLNDDFDPIESIKPEFWEMIERFNLLSKKEREKCKIHTGGCQQF